MAWWYGTFVASGWKSYRRGTNEQITKPGPANVWCTGGGWWIAPTIGSKSWIEKRVGIEASVPADDVERMMRVHARG